MTIFLEFLTYFNFFLILIAVFLVVIAPFVIIAAAFKKKEPAKDITKNIHITVTIESIDEEKENFN